MPDPGKRHELEDARLKLQNDVRTSLLQAIGGAAITLGAFFTYQQLKTGREQLRVAMQGQITERFTRAIDQLGNDKGQLDVTLGGIYALQRIATDSPGDQATIAEVLTAYVRGHAPWPPTRPGQYVKDAPLDQLPSLQERSPDVQAALTVLGRMPPSGRGALNLSGTDLRRANLLGANLEGTPPGTRFVVGGANVRYTGGSGPNLTGAHLEGADLSLARLTRANLSNAVLVGAHLRIAVLVGANLSSARLDQAEMYGAWLDGANLSGAWLGGADLRVAPGLTQAQLDAARGDATSRLPDGLERPASWLTGEDAPVAGP